MKHFVFEGSDKKELDGYLYENENAKAVVLIVHGMQEYAGRYADFAKYLNQNGFIVCTSDLRGHGERAKDAPGYDEGDIFEKIVGDQKILISKMKNDYKLPLYVFGHSYGSFVTQRLIRDNAGADKYVVCGSAYTNALLYKAAKIISKIGRFFKGKKATAMLIEKMSFGGYKKGFEGGNWLSRDENNWKAYKASSLCGQPFPYNFYVSMFKGLISNYKGIEKANKQTPIYLIAGSCDPVGGKGKQVKQLFDFYKKVGLNVSMKLFEGGRHEIINETNKEEVYADVVSFFKK